jgi:FixJ family two-component response regulator
MSIPGSAKEIMISIVDDDESVRKATKVLISSLGYSATAFASAEEFLDSGQVADTTCLITDVQMPGMTGIELQSYLAVTGYKTPVILITAFPNESLRRRALDAGALGFLSKPFRTESLVACLEVALKQG